MQGILVFGRDNFYPPIQQGNIVRMNAEKCIYILKLTQQIRILDFRFNYFYQFMSDGHIAFREINIREADSGLYLKYFIGALLSELQGAPRKLLCLLKIVPFVSNMG